MILNGPDESIDNDFATTHTVVRRSRHIQKGKRSIVTTNQAHLDGVFDHAEETYHVYCSHPADSRECQRIFIDGVEDIIIKLPDHVGEGPFAQIVTMKLANEGFQMPSHHLQHRSLKQIDNLIYEVKVDYNFHQIKLKSDKPMLI